MINKPFKVGRDRNDDDVSLFLLYEFAVHARLADADLASEEVVEIAEHLERIEDNEEVAAEGDEVAAGRGNEEETSWLIWKRWLTPRWRPRKLSRSPTASASGEIGPLWACVGVGLVADE
ncbi:MAG TPA: hypothetical protein VJ625_14030 [Propionibacteriaceae bacterium]|nr:hypothetical protein [Propionibacteriaceae bacterium]